MATATTTTGEDKKSAAGSKAAKPAAKAAKPAPRSKADAGAAAPPDTRAAGKSAAKPTKAAKAAPAKRAPASANRQSEDSSMTGREHDEHVERVWELAKRIGIAMFVTWDGENQRARPLAASIEKDAGVIYFLTDVKGQKDEQVEEFPKVSVNFADHKHSKYVALAGKATISNDRARIKAIWSPFAKAWWDSPEDPDIRVIKFTPTDAELWDSPGRIVTTISMLAAAVTGRTPKIGENAKVVL